MGREEGWAQGLIDVVSGTKGAGTTGSVHPAYFLAAELPLYVYHPAYLDQGFLLFRA